MKRKHLNFSFIKKVSWTDAVEKGLPLLVVFFLILFVFVWPVPPFSKNKATLVIDFGNKKRAFEGETFKDMTVLDALNASTKAGNVDFSYAINGDNVNINKLDAYSTEDNRNKFLFFLNSSTIDSSQINKIKIKPGDEITIKTR